MHYEDDEKIDPRAVVFRILAKRRNYPIMELTTSKVSLEDVFMELTNQDEQADVKEYSEGRKECGQFIKKEIGSFYRSMMGYLYTAFFLLIAGVYFAAFNLQSGISEFGYVGKYDGRSSCCDSCTHNENSGRRAETENGSAFIYISGKDQSDRPRKVFAVLTVFTVPLLILATCPLGTFTVWKDLFTAVIFKLSCVLFYGSFLHCNRNFFISSLTENQIIAAVLTFAVALLSYLINGIGSLIKGYAVGNIISPFLQWLSLFQRYYDFVDGYFDVTHLVYYVSVVVCSCF